MQKEIKEGGEKVEGVSVGAVRDLMDGQTSKLRFVKGKKDQIFIHISHIL